MSGNLSFNGPPAHQALDRMRRKVPTPADLDWWSSKIDIYMKSSGALTLDKAMQLSEGRRTWEMHQRNLYLYKALKALGLDDSISSCEKLRKLWATYLSRGPWRELRDDDEPPAASSGFSEALFWASRYNDSLALCDRQIQRGVRQYFRAESHPHGSTL